MMTKTKTNKLRVGETINQFDGPHTIRTLCRGEGQARTIQRQTPGSVYRAVRGQWAVLKPIRREIPGSVMK